MIIENFDYHSQCGCHTVCPDLGAADAKPDTCQLLRTRISAQDLRSCPKMGLVCLCPPGTAVAILVCKWRMHDGFG